MRLYLQYKSQKSVHWFRIRKIINLNCLNMMLHLTSNIVKCYNVKRLSCLNLYFFLMPILFMKVWIILMNVTLVFTQLSVWMLPTKDMCFRNHIHTKLGHKYPQSKVHIVLKLVKVLRSVCTIHPRRASQVTSQKYKIQIYCLLDPQRKKCQAFIQFWRLQNLNLKT